MSLGSELALFIPSSYLLSLDVSFVLFHLSQDRQSYDTRRLTHNHTIIYYFQLYIPELVKLKNFPLDLFFKSP
jgi:hypothetical protein